MNILPITLFILLVMQTALPLRGVGGSAVATPPSLVGTNGSLGCASNTSCSLLHTLTAGNTFVVSIIPGTTGTGDCTNVVLGASETLTQAPNAQIAGNGGLALDMWYKKGITGSETTITFTCSHTIAFSSMYEITNVSTGLIGNTGYTTTGAAATTTVGPSMTLSSGTAVLIETASDGAGEDSVNAPWTNDCDGSRTCGAHYITTSGTYSATWNHHNSNSSASASNGAMFQ
jgi:hypothetical protein